jgi:Integrin beta chain VWA domain
MSLHTFASKAMKIAAQTHHVEKPLVIHQEELRHPHTGEKTYCYRVVGAKHGNGPSVMVFLDERGSAIEPIPRPAPKAAVSFLAKPLISGPTISPDTNVLTLNPGGTFDETITVTIPAHAGTGKADVYFLADTTGSMTGILGAVQTGANSVLSSLNGLGIDMVFGVGNYKDFDPSSAYAFQHQVSPTNSAAAVTTAINTWSAAGGGDTPEAAFFALDSLAVPSGGTIGWRAGSKRIIVWFADAPSHDPICKAISGLAADITEASVTAKLVAETITVLAISTATPGLDDDPKLGESGYDALCGPPGGTPGQGTRIATSTGGAFVTGINPGNIVNTIINLVKGAVGGINNVNLVPSATVAPFVTSITPAGGYGPLAGDKDQTLPFDVKFTGQPCKPVAQVVTGTIDAVADGKVIATKKVQITIPPCAFVYSVKFVCGIQEECDCECTPVRPGRYATEINIHNCTTTDVSLAMRFIPLVLAGAAAGREPNTAGARAEEKMTLPRQTATMVDCCRITQLLFRGESPGAMPLTVGFLELTATADVAVTAVYTGSGRDGGIVLDVEQIAGRRK